MVRSGKSTENPLLAMDRSIKSIENLLPAVTRRAPRHQRRGSLKQSGLISQNYAGYSIKTGLFRQSANYPREYI
jgi:hypothetical protein